VGHQQHVAHPTGRHGPKSKHRHHHRQPTLNFSKEAIYNVYKLKTTPELVRYHHVAAGFPTKPQWIAAIKNKQYASWPGLSVEAVRRHFPESDETHKGHGRKTPSTRQSHPHPKRLPGSDEHQAPVHTQRKRQHCRQRTPNS
jgi:hypothetical protein